MDKLKFGPQSERHSSHNIIREQGASQFFTFKEIKVKLFCGRNGYILLSCIIFLCTTSVCTSLMCISLMVEHENVVTYHMLHHTMQCFKVV